MVQSARGDCTMAVKKSHFCHKRILLEVTMNTVLLKISGEALANPKHNIASENIELVINTIKALLAINIKVAIVIGGGNICRGQEMYQNLGIERINADYMGMIATVINGITLRDVCKNNNIPCSLYAPFVVGHFVTPYDPNKAKEDLNNNKLVIFVGGTGNPFFSTDSCAALRGLEMSVDMIVKATNTDGVYNKDPKKHSDAIKYKSVSMSEVITKEIAVMDQTAFVLCRENKLPIFVYDMHHPEVLIKFIKNQQENGGSYITVD